MLFKGQRGRRACAYLVGPLSILAFVLFEFRAPATISIDGKISLKALQRKVQVQDQTLPPYSNSATESFQRVLGSPSYDSAPSTHREIFSVSTADRNYFLLDFGQFALHPSIIPHPTETNVWIIIAQNETMAMKNYMWFAEVACNATFQSGALRCIDEPITLSIPPSVGVNCNGPLKYFADSVGPHEARVFFGPKAPQLMYGSNSAHTCFGQFMLDFRTVADLGFERVRRGEFLSATELQKPSPYLAIEKNWFVFWDKAGQIYVHYDITPFRGFAQLGYDGTVGPNLASSSYASDSKCMAKYMPKTSQELGPLDNIPSESLHQATNSLSITLCKRSEPWCVPENSNTFIMTVFHHKTYKWSHAVYEPYVMLFRQVAPFEIHGITTRPIWISGRGGPGTGRKPATLPAETLATWSQTEMVQLTSLSWKDPSQKYHGHIDDVLFMAFGIEDSKSAGIDVKVGDLVAELGLCRDT